MERYKAHTHLDDPRMQRISENSSNGDGPTSTQSTPFPSIRISPASPRPDFTSEPCALDVLVESSSRRAMQYEHEIKDLEAKLAEDLSNSRAIDNILREVVRSLQHTERSTKLALSATVPYLNHTLADDRATLHDLSDHLPEVGRQVRDIRNVYDCGRVKAKDLITSLDWLNTPIPLRLRTIIFTPHAPVSARWKALFRALFALIFLTCAWIAWITLRGAVRAHRQRLVWGERLMS